MPPRHAPFRYCFAMVTFETRLYDESHVFLIGVGVILDDVCGGGPHHVDRGIKQWEECIDVDQWDDRVKAGCRVRRFRTCRAEASMSHSKSGSGGGCDGLDTGRRLFFKAA